MQSFRNRILIFAALVLSLPGTRLAGGSADSYDENFRPQYQFTPAKNWMNDPNGTIFYKGEYHLFYQYNPFANEWGHMSWGHAVSRDLVHWQHLPVAIPEGNGVMIFSGSAVVDWHNSSGFCLPSGAGDESCLVAIYAGHTPRLQTQNLAYSNDNGRTWTKYPGNPVIDLHLKDFRDPKVFWHEPTHKWVMVAALSPQHKMRLFASTDLKHWTALSDFGPAGAVGGVWECPDLFPLPVQGEAGKTKWVLSVNLNPGGVQGGSGNQYFVGEFDGTKFTSDNASNKILWADWGRDFYASTSFSDIPTSDGRRIWMGWLGNWDYAKKVPTFPWRGIQTFPRQLMLRRVADGLRLVQEPVAELATLRGEHTAIEGQSVAEANRALQAKGVRGETLEIEAEIDPGSAGEFGFKVRKGAHEETLVGMDERAGKLFVDRTHSGNVGFSPEFAGRHAGPLAIEKGKTVKIHIYVDRSSVQVFANDGETVITDGIFPARSSDGIELYSKGGAARLVKMDIWNLQPTWR